MQAINALGADVLSLEEIENSAKYDGPENRDVALAKLVDRAQRRRRLATSGRSCRPRRRPTSRRWRSRT